MIVFSSGDHQAVSVLGDCVPEHRATNSGLSQERGHEAFYSLGWLISSRIR